MAQNYNVGIFGGVEYGGCEEVNTCGNINHGGSRVDEGLDDLFEIHFFE